MQGAREAQGTLFKTCFFQVVFDTVVNTFEMKFENEGYKQMIAAKEARKDTSMPIRAATIFEMFPFCVLFNVSITSSRYDTMPG